MLGGCGGCKLMVVSGDIAAAAAGKLAPPWWLTRSPAHLLVRLPTSILQPRPARLGVARVVRHRPDPHHFHALLVSGSSLLGMGS